MHFQSLCARPQRLLRSAQRRFLNNGGPPPVEPRGPGSTAERSMQPLRRFRILGLRAGSKAFARGRKRPRAEPAALVHRVPAALDPTNVGLHVVDVVRNEIIHRNHLHPESVGQLIYRDDKTDRNGSKDRRIYCWFTRELAAGHMARRWDMSRRFRVLTSGRMISNLPAEQLNRCPHSHQMSEMARDEPGQPATGGAR
jgi:hypothetical protein